MSNKSKIRKRSEEENSENKKNRPSISGKIDNLSSTESDESTEIMGEQITSSNFDKIFLNAFVRALDNKHIAKKLTETFAAECKIINDQFTKQLETKINLIDVKTELNDERIAAIEIQNDETEQERRSRNLIIKGFPKSDNPKTVICSEIKRRLDIEIKTEDIKYAIPIDNTTDHSTSYKINFYEQKTRDKVYSNRMLLKGTNIYVNEDLTIRRSKLAFDARQHIKSLTGANTWTQDGKVFVKYSPSAKPRAILTSADLKKPDATQTEEDAQQTTSSP